MNGFARPLHIALFLFITTLFIAVANCATFEVFNNCGDTVWAAAVPGGGRQLNHGESWTVDAPAGTKGARIWARTGCSFDGSGHGHCTTGDCNGQLVCQGYGVAPNTLAEYSLNQYMNLDFFDISLIQGFNVPMDFSPVSGGCTRGIRCAADINGQCPGPLRVQGGCSNPCTTDPNCDPNGYPKFYKNLCPDAYSYPKDDPTSTFTCPAGTNYKVTFCP